MKKTIFLFAVLLISMSAFSQQRRTKSFMGWYLAKDAPAKLNELKLNLGTTVIGVFPEISYEHVLSEDFSAGASVGINLNSDYYPLNFAVTPYGRWFFGGNSTSLQKYGAGFFIEASGSVFGVRTSHLAEDAKPDGDLGAGLGVAVGLKHVTRNNWLGELYVGAGRDFVNDGAYPRMGISIGKRF